MKIGFLTVVKLISVDFLEEITNYELFLKNKIYLSRTFCGGKQETGSRSLKSLHGGRRNSGGSQRDVESDGERAAEQRPPEAAASAWACRPCHQI